MANEADRTLTVRVIRSGGFAGISREWDVRADGDAIDDWLGLIEACPWHTPPPRDPVSRDRFSWRIEARAPKLRRGATIADAHLEGPWRALVARVQDEGD